MAGSSFCGIDCEDDEWLTRYLGGDSGSSEAAQFPAVNLARSVLARQQSRIKAERKARRRAQVEIEAEAVERCHRCGGTNHKRSNCPFLKSFPKVRWRKRHVCYDTQTHGHSLVCCLDMGRCFTCGQPGHLMRNCPKGDPSTSRDDHFLM